MTFSIVARAAGTSGGTAYGVAVASKFLAVGSAVPAVDARWGALATQASANLAYRPQGLALLRTGTAAADVVAGVTAADPGRDSRQLGVIAATGPGATYTGAGCLDWAGGLAGPDFAVQGNILTGPGVVEAMRDAFLGSAGRSLPYRLLAALLAGDGAGGDRRGRQSAALLVAEVGAGYGAPRPGENGGAGASDIAVDLRIDDHSDPVPELARLLDLHELYFGRPDPATLLDLDGTLADEVRGLLVALGHTGADLDATLAGWASIENYEERLVPGRIDPLVLDRLRAAADAGKPTDAAAVGRSTTNDDEESA